jgi:simple sugar transport system ATP-binding protein
VSRDDIVLTGITKRFGPVVANEDVDLRLRRGEVHALLGENGAGKTTLMNILSGLYRPDAGEIAVWGEPRRFGSPRDALECGIGMVHQDFQLVDVFTVTENILLGARSGGFRIDREGAARRIVDLAVANGLPVPPRAYIRQLSLGERQRVEILKLLYRGADLLMLDEPTSVLSLREAEELYGTLRSLAAAGKAVVFVTHKLREVLAAADRITVLRRGRVVASVSNRETSAEDLGHLMLGTSVTRPADRREELGGRTVLRLSGLSARNDQGRRALRDVDLTVRAGEIVGVVGVAGNGQSELCDVVAGLRRCTAGTIELDGQDVTRVGPKEMIRLGVRYVPETRLGVGLVPELSLTDNIMLRDYRRAPFGRGIFVTRAAGRAVARTVIEQFRVRARGPDVAVGELSGGNQQKLLLGRELFETPRLLVAAYPTRGLDLEAAATIHQRLIQLRASGAAVLVVSEDLDEALSLVDRLAVMYGGEIVHVQSAREANRRHLGALMGGAVSGRRAS